MTNELSESGCLCESIENRKEFLDGFCIKSEEDDLQSDGYLFLDPNHTIRRKAARLLDQIAIAFPDQIYSSISQIEENYKADTWIKK